METILLIYTDGGNLVENEFDWLISKCVCVTLTNKTIELLSVYHSYHQKSATIISIFLKLLKNFSSNGKIRYYCTAHTTITEQCAVVHCGLTTRKNGSYSSRTTQTVVGQQFSTPHSGP